MELANRPRLEDYREKYGKHFKMERRNGILQVQMHTDGGPVNFNLHVHNDWPQLWMDIGNDPDNEVLIFTGAGDKWIDANAALPASAAPQSSQNADEGASDRSCSAGGSFCRCLQPYRPRPALPRALLRR